MEAEKFCCLRSLFAHQESPNAGHIEEVLSKGGVEHLRTPFTISYSILCSSNICLLGGDGSRSDLLVDQKGHLVGRINIAKDTTDPRIEFISQNHNLEHFTISVQ